jgi:uncharacterized protein with NRDE domain
MCLILLAWQAHPDYPLVVAANRDEFHARPSAPAAFWDDRPAILGGRDLEAMGTWLGVTRGGKFAAVTNYRDPRDMAAPSSASRGSLVSSYLENGDAAAEFVSNVDKSGDAYRGFNLLAADHSELWWTSNRGNGARQLAPGVYGLSNHLLDTAWPKVERGKRALRDALRDEPAIETLFELIAPTDAADDAELPDTGVGLERERMLSAMRIVSPGYGTRCSTVLMQRRDGRVQFAERLFTPQGDATDTLRYEFSLSD